MRTRFNLETAVSREVFLFHCDGGWDILGCAARDLPKFLPIYKQQSVTGVADRLARNRVVQKSSAGED